MTHPDGSTVLPDRPLDLHESWTKAGPVLSHLPDPRLHEIQEISEASIGEPGPMSLFGFAVATLLVALPISNLMPQATTLAAIPALLVFGGIGQFIGGLVAYRKGNTFAATAFCSFGANNVVVSTFFLFQAIGLFPKNNDTMLFLAIDLFCFAYIAFILFLAAFKLNAAFVLVLLALFPGYGLAAFGNLSSMPAVIGHIGGWFLIISAGLAFYAGGALVLNSTYERTILPMFSRASTAPRAVRRSAPARAVRTVPPADGTH
jgi:hypothetical protein